jgi:hypothetical protein
MAPKIGSKSLLRVTLRPILSIDQGSIVGPVLLHELTFCALRSSSFVASARNSCLGIDEALERLARDAQLLAQVAR